MYGQRHRSHAKARRFLRERDPNTQSGRGGKGQEDENLGEGDFARQARNRPGWIRKVPRNLVCVSICQTNPPLTNDLGFPSSEVKNSLSAMVWPLCFRLCLTSSQLPPRGTQCHRCQVKPSPPSPPRPLGHYLRLHPSPTWDQQTTMVPAALDPPQSCPDLLCGF